MTDSIVCTLGQYDIPIIQMQPPFKVDLLDSNIAVFGSSMNGKTNFVRLLINILHKIRNEKMNKYSFWILVEHFRHMKEHH